MRVFGERLAREHGEIGGGCACGARPLVRLGAGGSGGGFRFGKARRARALAGNVARAFARDIARAFARGIGRRVLGFGESAATATPATSTASATLATLGP